MTEEGNVPEAEAIDGLEEKPAAAAPDRFEVKWKKRNEPQPSRQEESPTGATEGEESPAALRRQLAEAEDRIRTLQDRWQRAAADLANLRRRTEQDREDVERFASMLLVQELLPVLDNFERAIATIPGNLALLTWIHGVMLIERHLRAILEHQGLTAIESAGRTFTPYEMEAISERETTDAAPNTVLQEYQRGYTMHGRVIRPALVEVAKAPSAAPQPQPETTDAGDVLEVAEGAQTENVGP